MKKHLFLTGPEGCGKSALLRRVLGERLACAGGFVTCPAPDDIGRILLCPAAAAAGAEGYETRSFLDLSRTPPTHDTEVFRGFGVQLLEEAEYYPYFVMDEFGGFELLIPQFRNALSRQLSSELPCVGVLRTREDAEALRRRLGLGEKIEAYTLRLHQALAADEDTELISVTGRDDPAAEALLRQWMREYGI